MTTDDWTSTDLTLWESAFRRLKERFQDAEQRKLRVDVLLVEGGEVGEFPPGKGGLALYENKPWLFGRCEHWLGVPNRWFYQLTGTKEAGRELDGIAAEAGRALVNSPLWVLRDIADEAGRALIDPPPLFDETPPLCLPKDDGFKWVFAVFALAWHGYRGTPLQATPRKVWHGNRQAKLDDLGRLRELDRVRQTTYNEPPNEFLAAIPDPPNRWYSTLDDLAAASVLACDILLMLGRSGQPTVTPPGPQDWRDLAETCRGTAHRLNATAGGPLDDGLLRGLLAELADRSRRLGLAAPPLAWIRGDRGEGLDYSFPEGARQATPLWLFSPTVPDGLPGLLGAVAGAAGVTVRRRHGDHEQARREAAAALESWLHFAERKAAELETPPPAAAISTPGTKQSEGTGTGSQGEKPPAPPETVDAFGYVTNPKDQTAYLAATDILRKYTPAALATTYKQLRAVLDKHPKIRRCQERKNRLRVHLADWTNHVQGETSKVDGDGLLDDELEIEARKAEIRRRKTPGK